MRYYSFDPALRTYNGVIVVDDPAEGEEAPPQPPNCLTVAPELPPPVGKMYLASAEGTWVPVDYDYYLVKPSEPPPEGIPTEQMMVDALVKGLQGKLDQAAQALGYDSIATAITYRGDPNPRFDAEANGLFAFRSGTWTTAYAYLERVKLGEVSFPTLEEAIAMMPELVINYPS